VTLPSCPRAISDNLAFAEFSPEAQEAIRRAIGDEALLSAIERSRAEGDGSALVLSDTEAEKVHLALKQLATRRAS
jgi:hypothetical protein